MCGRFTLHATDEDLNDFFDLTEKISGAPRYNIAPSQNIWGIRRATTTQARTASLFHWGLIPPWAEDKRIAYSMINARTETARTKPSFRAPFRTQRCLIPANGYYEWKTSGKKKQPFLIEKPDKGLVAFAGLWSKWESPQGATVESCTILTTEASARLREIHGRMPLIIASESFDNWLDPGALPHESLLAPYPHDDLIFRPVSTHVNSVAHDDPSCMSPREKSPQLELL